MKKPTVVIGGGPAGLTTAYELARRDLPAVVFEKDSVVGGISRTETHEGYRFDIGGHRFFTKIAEVNELWHELLPDDFLERPRMSRIFYRGKYFDYPLRPLDALGKLGPFEATRIVLSYLKVRLTPRGEERSFEDWVVNRFGRRLFEVFFKSYTEKVWGIPCDQISADWAAQRIKNLDLKTAIRSALLGQGKKDGEVVTTLIDRFHYPRFGPGMMWERCQERCAEMGVETRMNTEVVRLRHDGERVHSVDVRHDGRVETIEADNVVSTMPVPLLLRALDPPPPAEVLEAAASLKFRDFLTVVLLVDRAELFPDNWIYIHAPEVKVGRVQNFKNWSPEMVPDPSKTSLGLEYFVQEGDGLWDSSDEELCELGKQEIEALGLTDGAAVVGHAVVRMPKAYPVYDQNYESALAVAREYLAGLDNLQLIGRNGQHRYNNQDHSMLTGMLAAQNVAGADHDLWAVTDDDSYLETDTSKSGEEKVLGRAVPRPLDADESDLDFKEVVSSIFAHFDPVALGVAVGLASGLSLFLATAVLLLRGGEVVGPNLSLLSHFLISFEVSWAGAALGGLEAGVGGFVFGYVLARVINFLTDLVGDSVLREAQLEEVLDPLDAGKPPKR